MTNFSFAPGLLGSLGLNFWGQICAWAKILGSCLHRHLADQPALLTQAGILGWETGKPEVMGWRVVGDVET